MTTSGQPRTKIPAVHIRTVRSEYERLGATPPAVSQLVRWIGPNGLDAVLAAVERVAERHGTLPFSEVERELRADSRRARSAARADAEAVR